MDFTSIVPAIYGARDVRGLVHIIMWAQPRTTEALLAQKGRDTLVISEMWNCAEKRFVMHGG
jgi:hypothetical protein